MKRIVLIACVSKKKNAPARACDLYQSPLFQKAYRYAEQLTPDDIFILSAKYGLVSSQNVIEPYDETLNNRSTESIQAWANSVIDQLRKFADLHNDEFVILAGLKYRKFLIPHLRNSTVPLEGLGIGKQLQKLDAIRKQSVEATCESLHDFTRKVNAFRFPFERSQIPKNGIYLLFEKGETGHGGNRIVRVGTHTGQGQLPSRLNQHFMKPNKDRSIFRKNIGRCLLSKDVDDYLAVWEVDLTPVAARKNLPFGFDKIRQSAIEAKVTRYIQNNFEFVVVGVSNREDRLRLESGLVSLISRCTDCGPSPSWLGNFSPNEKIRNSGLWQVNELYKTPLEIDEVRRMFTNIDL